MILETKIDRTKILENFYWLFTENGTPIEADWIIFQYWLKLLYLTYSNSQCSQSLKILLLLLWNNRANLI